MPLHITDPAAERAVRELARKRGLTLTRAVEVAATEALARGTDAGGEQEAEIARIQAKIGAYKRRREAIASHKDFFDWVGEEP